MDSSNNNNDQIMSMVSTIENLKRELEILRETSDEEYAIAVAIAARDRKQLERQITLLTRERDDALQKLQRNYNTTSRYNQTNEEEELQRKVSELTQERDDALLALKINQNIAFTNTHRPLESDDDDEEDGHVEEEIEELKYQIYKLKEERDDVIALHKMEQRHVKDLREELITLQIQIQEAQDSCATYKSKFEQAQSQYEQAQSQLDQIFLPLRDVDTQLDQILDDIRDSDRDLKPEGDDDEVEETEYESCSDDFGDLICEEEEVNNTTSSTTHKAATPTILSNQNVFSYKHSSSNEEEEDEEETVTFDTIDTACVEEEEDEQKGNNDDNHHAFDQVLSSLFVFFNDIVGGEDNDVNESMKKFSERPVNHETQRFHDAILDAVNRQEHKSSSSIVVVEEERQDRTNTDDAVQGGDEEERVFEEESTVSTETRDEEARRPSLTEILSVAEAIVEEDSEEDEDEQKDGESFCSEIEIFEDEVEPTSKKFSEQPRPKGEIFQDVMVEKTIQRDGNDKFYTPPSTPLKEYGERRHVGSLQWQLLEMQTKQNWIHGLFHELPLTRAVM